MAGPDCLTTGKRNTDNNAATQIVDIKQLANKRRRERPGQAGGSGNNDSAYMDTIEDAP